MGTSFTEIYDRFMMLNQDYRLLALFEASKTDFENYLEAWLDDAIVEFNICDQSLNADYDTKTFDVELSLLNKVIIANLMIKYWMMKNMNDITQMNLHVLDKDFKVFSEAQNMEAKKNMLIQHTEKCSQMLIDYGYTNPSANDWSNWFNQNFAAEV